MSSDPLISLLKATLQPGGTAPLVSIGWNDSSMSTAFYNVQFVHSAIDEMGRRLQSHVVDPITPLERLAIELLLASAYLSDAKDREAAVARWVDYQANPKPE